MGVCDWQVHAGGAVSGRCVQGGVIGVLCALGVFDWQGCVGGAI